jgi:23S rRNA pseudouridine2605 synthase
LYQNIKVNIKGENTMDNKKFNNSKKSKDTNSLNDKKNIEHSPREIRLNKFIANAGICSRREADELIKGGHITVNNKQRTELGTKVTHKDIIRYKGKHLTSEKKIYILLNKPKDVVTTRKDEHAKHTVIDLVKHACPERIYPIGRLDKDTTGVLLLTNDGELTKYLTHPKYNKKKIYKITLDKEVTKPDLLKIAEGMKIEEDYIKPDAISYVAGEDKTNIGIEIHTGQNRIVRRTFEALGYEVKKLDRVVFAGLTKKNVPRGKWRFLTEKEVNILKMKSFK